MHGTTGIINSWSVYEENSALCNYIFKKNLFIFTQFIIKDTHLIPHVFRIIYQ